MLVKSLWIAWVNKTEARAGLINASVVVLDPAAAQPIGHLHDKQAQKLAALKRVQATVQSEMPFVCTLGCI